MPVFSMDALACWSDGQWSDVAPAGAIRGFSIDTRTLSAGSLYVALKGDHFDGHDFVAEAFQRGAVAAMVSAQWRGAQPAWPLLRVADTRKALLALAGGYRDSLPVRIIAVTGSAGKTTVKEMLADILSRAAPTARTKGNWNNEIGLPLSLLQLEPAHQFGVFELGMNHPGELEPLCRLLRPEAGVVTSIGPAHIEFFGSVKEIALEKATLLRALPRLGLAVLNRDDEWFDLLAAQSGAACRTVSLEREADVRGVWQRDHPQQCVVRERNAPAEHELKLPAPGRHMAANALLAAAAARSFGVSWEQILEALSTFRALPMRWYEEQVAGANFVNDGYNANPLSMQAAVNAFALASCPGRRWLVLGGMRELGWAERSEHLQLGRFIAAGNWAGLLTVGPLGALIAEGARDAGALRMPVQTAPDPAAAAGLLAEWVRPGDAVLLKASRGEKIENVLAEFKKLNTSNPKPMEEP